MSFLPKLKEIKAFVLDIDGVLTDSTILITETGEQLRKFNIKDGYALQLAVKKGYFFCIISGGRSQTVVGRFAGLGITDVYLGVDKKVDVFNDFLSRHQLSADEVMYMGDDIPDLPVMKLAGIPVCPADAVEEVKTISAYISSRKGGDACVREVIEMVLKVQGKWFDANPSGQEEQIPSV